MSGIGPAPGDIGPLRQSVFVHLREAIIRGDFRPGEHLIEANLAEQFGVSRGPIREALYMLSYDGWVHLRPRLGAFVHSATMAEIEELFAARRLIEGETAYLAATSAPQGLPDAREHLHDILAVSRAEIEKGVPDPQVISEVNARFHNHVAVLSGNRIFADLLARMSRLSRWHYVSMVSARAVDALHEHSMIADAIIAGDGESARELVTSHIEAAFSALANWEDPRHDAGHARSSGHRAKA
jgi:DNA-binding GntR family transcriptional regulator